MYSEYYYIQELFSWIHFLVKMVVFGTVTSLDSSAMAKAMLLKSDTVHSKNPIFYGEGLQLNTSLVSAFNQFQTWPDERLSK